MILTLFPFLSFPAVVKRLVALLALESRNICLLPVPIYNEKTTATKTRSINYENSTEYACIENMYVDLEQSNQKEVHKSGIKILRLLKGLFCFIGDRLEWDPVKINAFCPWPYTIE
jgi:hypothetical protein